jgi:SAM-dependent methyltransferase
MSEHHERMDERSFATQRAASSRDVLKFYEAYSASWDERFGNRPTVAAFHRLRLESLLRLARFRRTDRAIELGAGTGPYADAIAPLVHELTCVDGAQGMLDVLQRKHAGFPNLSVRRVDLEEPLDGPLVDADVVFMFGLLEHIIETKVFAANCRRMLRPGGRLVLVAPNGRSPWYGALRKLFRAGAHCTSDKYYTVEECDALFSTQGLTREGLVYWGFAPAGVPRLLYYALHGVGALMSLTPLRQYAGGMTVSYLLDATQAPPV